MATLEEVLQTRKELYEKSSGIIKKKGMDYNRNQQEKDTLFNMRVSSLLGITNNPCQGILVRLSDKLMQLSSLTVDPSQNPEVKDESVEDTIADAHNYLDYLLVFYREEREKIQNENKR